MKNRRALAVAVAGALCAAGCSRCGKPEPAFIPERFLPAGSAVAVIVPRLESSSTQLHALYVAVGAGPGGGEVREAFGNLKFQLGFDPLTAAGQREVGLDPARGGAAAIAWGGPPLLVLPVADAAKLDAAVTRLARDRLGAVARTSADVSGEQVVSYRAGEGKPVALSYALVSSWALLAPGVEGASLVAGAARRARSGTDSLSQSAPFASARQSLGDGFAALAFAPPGSPALLEVPGARDGAALGLRADDRHLAVRAVLLLAPDRAPSWQKLVGAAGAELTGKLDPDCALVGRFGGDFAVLGEKLLPLLPAFAKRILTEEKLDAQKEIFELLAPGAVFGVSVAPTLDLSALNAQALDPTRVNPFRLVHLQAAGRAKDPKAARASLEKLAALGPKYGATLKAASLGNDGRAWTATYALGEGLTWGIEGDRLTAAGGTGRFDSLQKRLASPSPGWQPATPKAKAALEGGAGGLVVDFQSLVKSVRALPPEAYGTGPNGFVMRSLASRFVDPMARLTTFTLHLDVTSAAAIADAEVEALPQAQPK